MTRPNPYAEILALIEEELARVEIALEVVRGLAARYEPAAPVKLMPGRVNAERDAEIVRRAAAGESQASLAKIFGISQARVCTIVGDARFRAAREAER